MYVAFQVLLKNGPYGSYVQLGEDRKGNSPKRASVSHVCKSYTVTKHWNFLFWFYMILFFSFCLVLCGSLRCLSTHLLAIIGVDFNNAVKTIFIIVKYVCACMLACDLYELIHVLTKISMPTQEKILVQFYQPFYFLFSLSFFFLCVHCVWQMHHAFF